MSTKQENQTNTFVEESLLTPKNSSRFLVLLIIWSLTPLLVVISVQSMPVFWAFFFRFICAAPIAHLVLILRKQKLPLHKRAVLSYLSGSLGIFLSMILCYMSARYLTSSIISMSFGLSPLLSGVIGLIFYQRFLTKKQWLGILLGLVGLSVALGMFSHSLHVQPMGIMLIIPAVIFSVISLYLVNATQANVAPMAQTVGTLWVSFIGSLLILPFIISSFPTQMPPAKGLFAVGFLIFFASILAFLCMYDLNKRVSPTSIALVTIITPILATIWGNLFNHEVVHNETIVGLGLIVTGLSLFVWSQPKAPKKDGKS